MRVGLAARFLILALALATTPQTLACNFSASGPSGRDDDGEGADGEGGGIGTRADAAPSSPDAAPDICESWTPNMAVFAPCSVGDRGGDLLLDLPGSYVYNTSNGQLSAPGGAAVAHATQGLDNGVRLVSAQQIQVAADTTLRVVGAQPLLLISWGNIDLQGRIDVSSPREGESGAGANFEDCALTDSIGGEGGTALGGGGGGGGGFGGAGGQGGVGGGDATAGNIGVAAITGDLLRGGCPGGAGGIANGGTTGAQGGSGGGAVGLSALGQLTITGLIYAGGGGGAGGATENDSGGGGGGSGGMIWLDATSGFLGASAVLAANGGGGGEGSDGVALPSAPGLDGQDSETAALGGQGGGVGGDGGRGSDDVVLGGSEGFGRTDSGGGGGGGGAGMILIDDDLETVVGTILSPRPD